LFERFLDESRPDPPDIDTDLNPIYRDQTKKYIVDTFGEDNTCSIGTYGSYKTRAVILDIARALGLDIHEAMELTKSLELTVGIENEATGEEEDTSIDLVEWDELIEQFSDLKSYFEVHPEVLVHARVLRNQVKHMGTHAGGVIISDLNLKDRIPVFLDKSDKVISCWGESGNTTELSSIGLVKFDVLGLGNLTVVENCIKLIEQTSGKKLCREEVPIDDIESIRMGSKRDLVGIFQFENPSLKGVVDSVGMDCLEDVSAVTSLIRPGPRNMGMDREYARRKRGESWSDVKVLMNMLKKTYGVMVYQEQVMLIARELAGFSMAEANKLRKGIGKKKEHIVADLKTKFMRGSQKRIDEGSITEEEVETVWAKIAAFAKYGFCKCVDGDTRLKSESGEITVDEVKRMLEEKQPVILKSYDSSLVSNECEEVIDCGEIDAYELVLEGGSKVVCSMFHRFLCVDGKMHTVKEIVDQELDMVSVK
jgi:DNA polymerase-3 subunit alpha